MRFILLRRSFSTAAKSSEQNDVIDAKTLPKIQMPNRNAFVPQRFDDIPDGWKRGCRQGVCP